MGFLKLQIALPRRLAGRTYDLLCSVSLAIVTSARPRVPDPLSLRVDSSYPSVLELPIRIAVRNSGAYSEKTCVVPNGTCYSRVCRRRREGTSTDLNARAIVHAT